MLEGLYFPQSCRPIMLHFRVICAYLHIMSQILLQHFVPVRTRGQKHVPRDPKFVSRGCLSSRCLGIGPTPDFSAPILYIPEACWFQALLIHFNFAELELLCLLGSEIIAISLMPSRFQSVPSWCSLSL